MCTAAAAIAALADRAAALAEQIASLRAAANVHRDAPSFVRALFDHPLSLLAAEENWLAEYRATLTTKD